MYISKVVPYQGYAHCMTEMDFIQFSSEWYIDHADDASIVRSIPTPRSVCMARRSNAFAIDPMGLLYKCLETVGDKEYSVGSIDDSGVTVSLSSLQRWSALDPFREHRCRECRLVPSCLGGCAFRWLKNGRPDCVLTQSIALMESRLITLYEQTKTRCHAIGPDQQTGCL